MSAEDYARNRKISDTEHRRIAKLTYERDFRTRGHADRLSDGRVQKRGKKRARPQHGEDEVDDEQRSEILTKLATQIEENWMVAPGCAQPFFAVFAGERGANVDVSESLMHASGAITDVVAFLKPRGRIAVSRYRSCAKLGALLSFLSLYGLLDRSWIRAFSDKYARKNNAEGEEEEMDYTCDLAKRATALSEKITSSPDFSMVFSFIGGWTMPLDELMREFDAADQSERQPSMPLVCRLAMPEADVNPVKAAMRKFTRLLFGQFEQADARWLLVHYWSAMGRHTQNPAKWWDRWFKVSFSMGLHQMCGLYYRVYLMCVRDPVLLFLIPAYTRRYGVDRPKTVAASEDIYSQHEEHPCCFTPVFGRKYVPLCKSPHGLRHANPAKYLCSFSPHCTVTTIPIEGDMSEFRKLLDKDHTGCLDTVSRRKCIRRVTVEHRRIGGVVPSVDISAAAAEAKVDTRRAREKRRKSKCSVLAKPWVLYQEHRAAKYMRHYSYPVDKTWKQWRKTATAVEVAERQARWAQWLKNSCTLWKFRHVKEEWANRFKAAQQRAREAGRFSQGERTNVTQRVRPADALWQAGEHGTPLRPEKLQKSMETYSTMLQPEVRRRTAS